MSSKLVAKNTTINLLYTFINYGLSFVVRTLMIRYLGVEILGVNATIVDTVNLLSFSELGIQTSITYKMYKPIIDGDDKRLQQLFNLYRIAYFLVGTVILILGLCLLPFVRRIVNTTVDMRIVYAAYLMQLGLVALSYFSAYFRILFQTHQRQYVCIMYDMVVNIGILILEIIMFVMFKSYLMFLAMSYVCWIVNTWCIYRRAKKDYPTIIPYCRAERSDVHQLIMDVKEVILSTISGCVYSSTDNILISYFFGSVTTGLVSNYRMVTKIMRSVISTANYAATPAWGDFLNKDENKNRILSFYEGSIFLEYCACAVLLVPTLVLIDDFIVLWIGNSFLIDRWVIILIVMDIFFTNLNEPTYVILSSLGMFRENKISSIWAAAVNIIFSLLLVHFIGLPGIFAGTVVAVIAYWIIRSWYVNRRCFNSVKIYIRFWLNNAIYVASFTALVAVSSLAVSRISIDNSIISFAVKGVTVELVVAVLSLAEWFKTARFRFLIERVKAVIH